MGLLNNLVSEFTHSGQHGSGHQQQQGPPPVSPPWYAEWDGRDQRWLFVNQQTGDRTFTYPGPGYAQQQSSYGNNQGSYNPTGGYGQQPQQQQQKQGGNWGKYAAAGAVGVAGGALLMHEGEEAKQDWDREKYRLESDVTNFPENAANWTGEQVGHVENFDDRVENRFDNTVNDFENFPENAAEWTGRKVQEVEDIPQDIENKWDNDVDRIDNFGDRIDNAYDDGRDEQRYEDGQDDSNW